MEEKIEDPSLDADQDEKFDTYGDAAPVPASSSAGTSSWVAYKDDEDRVYYFNTETNETQWDKPDGFVSVAEASGDDVPEEHGEPDTGGFEPPEGDAAANEASEPMDIDQVQQPLQEIETEIDPAVKRVQDAEQALSRTDSVLEPDCVRNVAELVTSEGGNPEKAINALIDNFYGQTAICGLLARWLADLKPSDKSQGLQPTLGAADTIRDVAQGVICKIAKDRFCKETADSILNLSKSEAAFLEEMMDSPRWRKLLIDLSATHKDSAVLMYCLRTISKRGHHREIAKRVNQSEHFSVFNAMLLSELAVIGSLSVSAGSDAASAVNLLDLVGDLRRTCSSTSYTYLYSVELLRYLEDKIRRDIRPSVTDRLARVQRKWEALAQDLESEMMDPTAASASSPLFRRRRLEVSLIICDLHQRQRKRRRLDDRFTVANRDCKLESALLEFLRRHATGIQLDDAVLDSMLPQGLDLSTATKTGKLLIDHPLALRALLGHLYKPGAGRVTLPSVRNKCARLIAIGVVAAEKAALDPGVDNAPTESDEVALTRMILDGSQLCEQLESMVSFLVSTGPSASALKTSPGQKLCALALKCAAVAQGVLMWAREFTGGADFAASASFPTLSVSVLSLVRLVCLEQPFTRRKGIDVALAFLKHSNPDISYQKVNAIKEQSLRLLIVLVTKGEVISVLSAVASRIQGQGSSELDASLIRYFVKGLLEVVRPPASMVFVWSFAAVLKSPRCVDAVRSPYFGDADKQKLAQLLQSFKSIKANAEGRSLGAADEALINSMNDLL